MLQWIFSPFVCATSVLDTCTPVTSQSMYCGQWARFVGLRLITWSFFFVTNRVHVQVWLLWELRPQAASLWNFFFMCLPADLLQPSLYQYTTGTSGVLDASGNICVPCCILDSGNVHTLIVHTYPLCFLRSVQLYITMLLLWHYEYHNPIHCFPHFSLPSMPNCNPSAKW